jgi:hypothetical protein
MRVIKGGDDRNERWERTIRRVCPITGRHVELEDVEAGRYVMPRIDGDSANGYEVYPTGEHALNVIELLLKEIKHEPKYLREVGNLVVSTLAEYRERLEMLETKGIKIVFDEDGLISEYIS